VGNSAFSAFERTLCLTKNFIFSVDYFHFRRSFVDSYISFFLLGRGRGRCGRNRMVVGFITTCAINAYHH
jgi:hypothetical protein